MVKVLRIARRRVLPAQHADRKKLYVHTMVLLISDNNRSAHHVHPAILLELLDAVRFWIDREEPEAGELSVKEVVGSLQRLASLDRNQCIHESILPQWEANFLGLLHRVCTTPEGSSPDAALLCADTFSKVERVFLCGLKARDEQMRLKFFKLYTAAIPRNVFSRLRFVVEQQDWEAVSGTFWLQHGITLHLDLIKGAETFFPAPNSGQAAPLLPGTPSLVFAQAGRRPHRKPAEKGKEKEREEGPSKEEEGKKKAEEGQGANTGQEENGGVGDKGEEGTAGEGEEQKEGEVKKEAGEQAGEKREEKKDEGEVRRGPRDA